MSLSYEPLWKMLEELNISKMEFAKMVDISNATLAKLGKNEPITLTTVDKICNELECKIENVVQHIPDHLLNQKKSNLSLKKGHIVLVDSSFDNLCPNSNSDSSTSTRVYVILEIKETTINKMSTWQYIASPITTIPTHYLSMYFENVLIDGKLNHGWISLDRLQDIPSEYFIRILGEMSNEINSKIEKFLNIVTELLDD